MKDLFRSIILKLLTLEARAVLRRHKPRIIAVTGSVGKTSSKDAVFAALKNQVFVRKSEKSYNGDIGVPLTILGVPNGWSHIWVWIHNLIRGALRIVSTAPYPAWLVIELGADRPGDISRALAWIEPDIVITTTFPDVPVHVEFYNSPEAVAQEELFPLTQLQVGGSAVMNLDDAYTARATLAPEVVRTTYGFDRSADVRAVRYRITTKRGIPSGLSFELQCDDEKIPITLPQCVGAGHVYAVLAGVAGARAAGVSCTDAAQAFETFTPPPGRSRLISGTDGVTLIDDTYNASPAAVEEALATLAKVPTAGARVAVLGDMLELGSYSVSEHARIGAFVARHASQVITVGVRAQGIADAAQKAGMSAAAIHAFERAHDAALFLKNTLQAGDVVLIKGSQGMRMERIVKSLMAEPERASELLPRQDAEWLKR